MGRIFSIILLTGLGIGIGFAAGRWFENLGPDKTNSTQAEPAIQSVLAEGKIKPLDGFRLITTLPGRKLTKLNVSEGSKVKADDIPLCVMADEALLKMQWDLALAKKDDLSVEVDQKILAAELNRSSALSALKQAKLNQMRLKAESKEASYVDQKIAASAKKLERLKELAKKETTSVFVSSQDIFEQELELEKARSEKENLEKAAEIAVATAEEALAIANQALDNAKNSKTESRSLRLGEAIAEKQYENSKLYSPIDGEVVKIYLKEGENVANLPVMEIADLSRLVVEADVYFASLAKISAGQNVKISSPALDKDLQGKVLSKSNYIGSSFLQSANPLAMTNQETAKVIIAIEPEYTQQARSFLNLQVTVEIDTE